MSTPKRNDWEALWRAPPSCKAALSASLPAAFLAGQCSPVEREREREMERGSHSLPKQRQRNPWGTGQKASWKANCISWKPDRGTHSGSSQCCTMQTMQICFILKQFLLPAQVDQSEALPWPMQTYAARDATLFEASSIIHTWQRTQTLVVCIVAGNWDSHHAH